MISPWFMENQSNNYTTKLLYEVGQVNGSWIRLFTSVVAISIHLFEKKNSRPKGTITWSNNIFIKNKEGIRATSGCNEKSSMKQSQSEKKTWGLRHLSCNKRVDDFIKFTLFFLIIIWYLDLYFILLWVQLIN